MPDTDPNAEATKAICNRIIRMTAPLAHTGIVRAYARIMQVFSPIAIAICTFLLSSWGVQIDTSSFASVLSSFEVSNGYPL